MRFIVFFFLFYSTLGQARMLQIIHTNDLHSYFTGNHKEAGGYARVLTKIKQLRAEAKNRGIEVLQVDAGDWGDGTSFYLADNGSDSIRALELLGIEVTTIGNHDHQLGGKSLGEQIRSANVKTKFTVANLIHTPEMNLGDVLLPYVDLDRGNIPIRIIGLTTPEQTFQYSIFPGRISDPVPLGEVEGRKAKLAGRELVIVLTHLGISQDEKLIQNSTAIDLVIGGHTHTKLSEAKWVKNKNGKAIPIVQAWAHGLAVGSLLLNIKEGGGVEIIDYKLHKIEAPLAPDPVMTDFVARAQDKRNLNFQFNWNEIIGETKTPMTGYVDGSPVYRSSCWGYHMATAARKAAGASVGIHISNFEGIYRPPGPITYADLADNFPHIRKFGDQGWEIVTVFLSGYKVKALMYWISRQGYGVTFSGLGYKKISDKGTYRIAFPAELALGIKTSFPAYRQYLQGLKYTGKYYWPVMVDYLKEHSPISCR